ncbi:putative ribonuclease H-like domain-containing protein [Tanacetum coccineum]
MQYGGVRWATAVKPSAGCSWKTHRKGLYWENPYSDAEDEGIFDSGCSRSMTGNMERLDDFQEFQGGKVTFGGGEGRITGKGTIRTPTLDFENVYYVKELQQFNLFSISQICDKKNRVLFTDTDCLVLSKDFMLPDESMVVLRVPRKHNLYTINLNNLSPRGNLACLLSKASVDESVKWHKRMGHVNYKNMNKLVKGVDRLGGKGSSVWNHQSLWQIRSWRLYTLSNVHVLETISGEVLYMFADVSYPLSVKLMEKMLKHKLEINKDVVGNDMTTAEQLIHFIKNQIAAAQVSLV